MLALTVFGALGLSHYALDVALMHTWAADKTKGRRPDMLEQRPFGSRFTDFYFCNRIFRVSVEVWPVAR